MFNLMAGEENMAFVTWFLLPDSYQVSANRLLPMNKKKTQKKGGSVCAKFHALNWAVLQRQIVEVKKKKKNICENNTCYWRESECVPSSCWLTEAARAQGKHGVQVP